MQDNEKNEKVLNKHFMSVMGRIIKEYREQTGRTIYAISAETSIPRSTWRDIEFEVSSDTNITNFCRIAEGLNKHPWELLREIYEKAGKNFSFTELNQ